MTIHFMITPWFSLSPRQRVILAGICALILTVGIARFAYTPFLPIMLNETSLDKLSGGWLATFNYIGYLSGVVLISFLSSLKTKFLFYRVNLVLAVLSTVLMAVTTDMVLWSILRFIGGLSSTAGIILAAGFVMGWLKQNGYKSALGIHFSGLGLGIAIPGLVIVLITPYFNWAEQWLIMGLFGILFFLPAWYLMPAPAVQPPSATKLEAPNHIWMRLMIAAYACAGVGYVISATFIVAILEEMPSLTGHGNLIWVMLGVAAIPSCILWDKVAEQLGETSAILTAYSIILLSILIPLFSESLLFNVIGALLFGATFAGIVSLMLVYVGHKFPHNPAKAMAKLTISYGIAQLIAPALAGYLSTLTGNYLSALWMAATIMIIGIVLVWRIQQFEGKKLT
ncbi:YbfB/YjiJ family MFS transporter [Methylophaga pinxianii]|uniref:YbfB/YjiJ family MFS transporter n=1 Tax=Methylophaga pinxianii TaxID=2881052 RepID=UPI001CF3A774|nr:YbfB/YjiJ family MFS transporter [Methylophaga pinxianii]MCB2427600.1 YbfB/YjiJ family MFS transporter [Methylophaga pinxianii]UPH46591.1 YbfB/YjiJ family MFS transporter [Methylophaga pinxianii]